MNKVTKFKEYTNKLVKSEKHKQSMQELVKSGKFEVKKYKESLQDWGVIYDMIPVGNTNDVFKIYTPSVASLNKYLGPEGAMIVLNEIVTKAANFVNVGKNMSDSQIAMTSNLIMAKYRKMTIADFKLFFTNLLCGEYGEFYDRFDGQLIMSKIKVYWEDRLNKAQLYSQVKHSENKKPVTIDKEGIKRMAGMFGKVLEKSNQVVKVSKEKNQGKVVIPGSKARGFNFETEYYESNDKPTIKHKNETNEDIDSV